MNGWQRWWQAPQTLGLRRALFQVHLWLGIGLGLYVLAISVSGSALLLKYRFYDWFEPKYITEPPPPGAVPLEGDALNARMAEVYAGYELGFTIEATTASDATYVVLGRDGEYFPHYFNQFTGMDIGAANPWPIRTIEAIAAFHAELFMGRDGRRLNGLGGLLFVVMSFSGLLLWWQGRQRWYRGFVILPSDRHGLLWQLHSFLGFWALLLMVAWGVSGFQLGFPAAMDTLVNWLDFDPADDRQPTAWLRFFRSVHFARFGDTELSRWGWILLSFIPTVIFLSGFVLWWRRVLLRWWRGVGCQA